MKRFLEVLKTLPPGWEIVFTPAKEWTGGFRVTVVGWYPHAPETAAEHRFCDRFEFTDTVSFQELERTRDPDALARMIRRDLDRVKADVEKRKEARP